MLNRRSLLRIFLSLLSLLFCFYLIAPIFSQNKKQVFYLKDYKKPNYNIEQVYLTIDLRENETLVTNKMTIKRLPFAKESEPLHLDGIKLKLSKVILNGKELKKDRYSLTETGMTIPNLGKISHLTIVTKIFPKDDGTVEGLYKSKDLFLTQCEAEGFRRITYYMDRPDVMSIFTTKLIAHRKYPTLLSNGEKIDSGKLKNQRHFSVWHDKSKKTSYLFAAVIGNLAFKKEAFVTKSGKKVDISFYTSKKDLNKIDYAMKALKSAMRFDEKVFNREYDLNTYMVVTTPKFNAAAMENKGLNIFDDDAVFAHKDTSTDNDFVHVYRTIGHEYFHNWTGNRITLRNWFQLGLKEGLTVYREQEFAKANFSPSLEIIKNANNIKTTQFREDSGPLSHAVRPQSYDTIDNFYTSTVYDKGAEVVRMLAIILGKDVFSKGMDLYFRRNDGKAVTWEEFLMAMEDASQRDLSQFRLWYTQSGTPCVKISSSYDSKNSRYKLSVEQILGDSFDKNEKKNLMIPLKIAFIGEKSKKKVDFIYGTKKSKEQLLLITKDKEEFIFSGIKEPVIPSLFRDFSAPVKIDYPYTNGELLFLFSHDDNTYNKWNAIQSYYKKLLINTIKRNDINQPIKVPKSLFKALRNTLKNKNFDLSFISQIITLANERSLYNGLESINPHKVYKRRNELHEIIGKELNHEFLELYQKLESDLKKRKYHFSKEDMAKRSLKNHSLKFLSYSKDKLATKLAIKQLEHSDNLTDRLPALSLLILFSPNDISKKATQNFYTKFKDEALVLDQWLSLQALYNKEDTIKHMESLLSHPAFDINNPNKVRSLIGTFVGSNPRFHDSNGDGYAFLSKIILDLDKENPDLASSFVRSFSIWRKLESPFKEKMHHAIQMLMNSPKVSLNLEEMIKKILN